MEDWQSRKYVILLKYRDYYYNYYYQNQAHNDRWKGIPLRLPPFGGVHCTVYVLMNLLVRTRTCNYFWR